MYNFPLIIGALFVICIAGRMDKEQTQNDKHETPQPLKTSETVYRDYVESIGGGWDE